MAPSRVSPKAQAVVLVAQVGGRGCDRRSSGEVEALHGSGVASEVLKASGWTRVSTQLGAAVLGHVNAPLPVHRS